MKITGSIIAFALGVAVSIAFEPQYLLRAVLTAFAGFMLGAAFTLMRSEL